MWHPYFLVAPPRAQAPAPVPAATPPRGSRLLAALAFAFSELRHRRFVTFLCLCAGAIGATTLWQLGVVAAGLFESRQRELSAEDPTAVRLTPRDSGDPAARFTPARLRALRELPWVAGGGPLIDVQVVASLGRGPERLVPLEGDVRPTAPLPDAIAWGSGRARAGEAVVSKALLLALGGRLGDAGPEPAVLRVRIGRTIDGHDQTAEFPLTIRGVLHRNQDPYRIDAPLALARDLDRWCCGQDVPDLPRRPAGAGPAPALDVAGALRATLYATSLDDVEPLVTHLREVHGYETVDQLARHRAVQRFGRAIGALVACLVAGTLLLAAVATFGMHAQKLRAAVFEIGVLRAHAIPDRGIVGIHALQGALLGVGALAAALVLQLALGPLLRGFLAGTFGVEPAALAPASPVGPWVLVASVAAVAIACGLAGAAIPAWWTCRRVSPVAALRRG